MSEIMVMKAPGGYLVPADEQSRETVGRWKLGQGVRVKAAKARDLVKHRKFFAMLNLGFDSWEPSGAQTYKGERVAKNFDRFRKDVLILAGHYEAVHNMKGEVRLEAKSIAFDKMEEDEFLQVYSDVADVLLTRVLKTYTREDLDAVVEQLLGFVT
jgi:hypothetical protein